MICSMFTLPKLRANDPKMDGWKITFRLGMSIFKGFVVSFREGKGIFFFATGREMIFD